MCPGFQNVDSVWTVREPRQYPNGVQQDLGMSGKYLEHARTVSGYPECCHELSCCLIVLDSMHVFRCLDSVWLSGY